MRTINLFLIVHFSFLILNCFAQQPGWEIIPSGTSQELNSVFFYDYEVGFACGNSGTVIKSIDSGKTWQNLSTPVTNDLNDLYVFNDSTLCVVGDSGTILFSVEGGNNWYVGPYFLTENYYSISFSETEGILGGSSQTIVQADFGGTNIAFFVVQSGFLGGGFWGACMLSPQIGFVAGENSIFQSLLGMTNDSGVNWDFHAFYLDGNEGRATGVDFTDLYIGFASASVWDGRGAIAKTTDSGINWVTTFFPDPLWDIDFPISNASQIGYAVGEAGVILKTYSAGDSWQQQQSGTTLRLNKVHFLDFDYGFAVGANGIILRTTTGGEPVTQVEEISSPISEFSLEQNYPNPFNPSTKIKYTVPNVIASGVKQSQLVTIKVYDVLGREVVTLVNEEKSAGIYEVVFDASSLTSGIYFYRMETGKFVDVKKMIILK